MGLLLVSRVCHRWISHKERIEASAVSFLWITMKWSDITQRRQTHSQIRVRFAPSPTGHLHLGGFRTAMYNYLFAKSKGGKFILRIEDTDRSRMVPGASKSLEDILNWLGTPPDESPLKGGDFGPYTQSERLEIYNKYINQLIQTGHAYPCFCTDKRLQLLKREAARTRTPNKYDRRCAALTPQEVSERLGRGDAHTVRFRLTPSAAEPFDDLVYGQCQHDVFELEGDPIIRKSDGFPTYHLANVVDDHLMEISHVLRGVEWQVSTPKHILLYRALGWEPPVMAHLPLILNANGTKLSKRQNDLHIQVLRERGYSGQAILNFVSLIGGGFEKKPYSLDTVFTSQQLTDQFCLEKVHSYPGRLDMTGLDELNRSCLKSDFQRDKTGMVERVRELVAAGQPHRWVATKTSDLPTVEARLAWALDRVTVLDDLLGPDLIFLWGAPPDDQLQQLRDQLTNADTLHTFVQLYRHTADVPVFLKECRDVCRQLHIKMPSVMRDLRLLLTGRSEGPPVKEVMELLGRAETLRRLTAGVGCGGASK